MRAETENGKEKTTLWYMNDEREMLPEHGGELHPRRGQEAFIKRMEEENLFPHEILKKAGSRA
jgi:hypothetical protein